jgi:Flp pilus assembly protein TadG
VIQKLIRRFIHDERGNSMVEFALVTTVVLVPLLFGVIEFGRLVWAKDMITSASREGVRYAIVHGTDCGLVAGCTLADSAAVANTVIARTQLSPITVKTEWAQDKDPGDTVTVTVSYTYTPIVKVPFLTSAKTITATSKQIVVY